MKAIDAKHGKFDMVICIGDFFADSESEDAELNALLDDKLEGIKIAFSTRGHDAHMKPTRASAYHDLYHARGASYTT